MCQDGQKNEAWDNRGLSGFSSLTYFLVKNLPLISIETQSIHA